VVNPQTVVVDMKQPWAAFPSSYLDGNGAEMMAPAMIHSKDGGATHPIGTGPFVFQSWTQGQSFKVNRNPNYWQKGLPYLDSIEFRVIGDGATAVSAMQSGDINMMLSQNASDANTLGSNFHVIKDWNSEVVSLQTNTIKSINGVSNPLSDIHARMALAYAIDRSAIAKLEGADVKTADSPFAPNGTWGVPLGQAGYASYDPTKAEAELAKYKADTGQATLHFTLLTTPDTDSLRITQAIQAQLKKVGISISIVSEEETGLIKHLVGANFQAVYMHNYSYPDPDTESIFWQSATIKGVGGVNINFAQYSNPQMEQDLKTGQQAGYVNQRQVAYKDLMHQINDNVLNIWLYRTPYSIIADKDIQGLGSLETIPWGNYQPKLWFANVWLSK
jgi:peptide/nickel transport system substrate-binding protein